MISVITPCFNILKDGRKDYFQKMMESIHNQSCKDIEHIVVDGKSDDGTLELLKLYKTKGWINHLVILERRGIYPALNAGIRIAVGDLIHIMNTDDYILDKDFFKISIDCLKQKEVDFTHADRVIKSRISNPDFIKRGNEVITFFRMPFRHQTMLIKKEVYNEVGLFDEKYEIASDYKFILKMILAGKKGVYIPKIFICSLDGGVSSNRNKCIEEVSQVLYEIYGSEYSLTKDDCRNIYLRKFTLPLILKIIFRIKNFKIQKSLFYGIFKSC